MKLLWFPVAVKFYCLLSGARHYQTCRVTSAIIVGKEMQFFVEEIIYGNIVYSINFFQLPKSSWTHETGWRFCSLSFFSRKDYVILGKVCSELQEGLICTRANLSSKSVCLKGSKALKNN